MYSWVAGNGDTVRTRKSPKVRVDQLPTSAATRDGRYYIAGAGDNAGTGQNPVSNHFSLVCIDTAGNLRWQYNYLNPVIRIGAQFPAAVAYAYLRRIVEAPRRGWWLLGDAQRDSVNYQLYAIEVDSGGRPRRARWVEPFGRAAFVQMFGSANALRLPDGSGYVVSGQVRLDSLGRASTHGFVARLDTALNVVWRTLLETPAPSGPVLNPVRYTSAVQQAADGSLRVLTYLVDPPRPALNEFEVWHLSAQGRPTRRDTYCSQVLATALPQNWQLLPGDTTILVSGRGQQRGAGGQLLAQPAWLAYFERPCRSQAVPVVTAARPGAGRAAGLALYPQPAAPGAVVRLALAGRVGGAAQVQLLDALGRPVATLAAADVGGQELALTLPAGLAPGLYAVRVLAAGRPVTTGRLLVQAP